MTQLSIIIPVYNVEKYIRPCIESIFRQGLDDSVFEMIIVNDGTKDKSMEMIADIISQHDNITVINQKNQGLSVARNNGINAAKGEYIILPDSDDLLIYNSLPYLLKHALSSKADLVVADFLKLNDDEVDKLDMFPIKLKDGSITEKTGEELFLEDLNPYECYVWRTLFRREFLLNNHLKFVPGIFIQDVPFTHECYLKAKKCIRASWFLNIYRCHNASTSANYNIKNAKDFCIAIAKTWELKDLTGITRREQKKLRDDIFVSFSKMICNTVHEIDNASERNDVIDFLKCQVPDLQFTNGTKQRITSFMFRYLPHSYLFIRYLYAKIFEDTIRPFIYHRLRRP